GGLSSEPDVELFFAYPQIPDPVMTAVIGSMAIVLRTNTNPQSFASAVRRQVSALDKDIPVSSVTTMTELESNSLAPRRFQMMLLALVAAIALALAEVGIYGVISYWVLRRTQEIGIRVALGARPANILWLVVRRGMILAFGGVILGLAAALGLTRLMAGLL